MSERMVGRKKAGTSTFSNPSLVSPTTPTLANPTSGFGVTNHAPVQTATEVSTEFQEAQSAGEQLSEPDVIKEKPLGHDISRISLFRSQATFSTGQIEKTHEPLTPEVVQRKCAACEEEEVQRATDNPVIQRDETSSLPPVPNYQLSPPSLLQPPDPASRYGLGMDMHLQLDPQLQAMAMQHIQQQLHPAAIRPALNQINLGVLPNQGSGSPNTPNPFATPTPPPAAPLVPAGAGPDTPQTATAGDLLSAIMAVPAIDGALNSLQTQASDRFSQDWRRLRTGEQVAVVSTTVLIGAGALAGVLSDPSTRQFALDQLNGKTFPVPGLNWLRLEMNTGGDSLMLGMHVDVGRLLPPSLGFGPSSPSAIGGPPQPEPAVPGQRTIQRVADLPEASPGQSIGQRIQQATSSGGSSLDKGVQQHLEQSLDTDLSGVQIHTNTEADRLNKSVNAIAFTSGQDIFFSAGSYNPSSSEGKHLIAHEVVHTVQQANGAVAGKATDAGVSISDPSDAFEQEAEQVADRVMRMPDLQAKELADSNFSTTPNRLPDSSLQTKSRDKLQLQTKEISRQASPLESNFKINHDISLTSSTPLTIQRQVANRQNPETAGSANARVKQQMNQALKQDQTNSPDGSPGSQPNNSTSQIDRTQVEQKKSELLSKAQPDSGRSSHEMQVEQTATKVVEEVNKPTKPLTDSKETAPPEQKAAKGEDGALPAAEQAANLANQAFAIADAQAVPNTPVEMVSPQPVIPMDAEGKLLPADPQGDAKILNLAAKVKVLREQGHSIRQQAALERSNAEIIRGNIKVAEAGIQQAEAGVEKSQTHLSYRREVVGQAKSALSTSEQKANMVAEQAPTYTAKADEGKEQSGPMAGEAGQLAAENSSKTPDDGEAAAKSQEQGQKLNKVNADIRSTDDAIAQTKVKAESLSQEAGEAKQTNTQTKVKISTMEATLTQTENKLSQMDQQNLAGRTQLASVKQGPAQMTASATALDEQGASLVQASIDLESRLHKTQENFQQGMSSVPGSTLTQNQEETGNTAFIQRTVAGRYEDRVNLNWGGKLTDELPPWVTGEQRASEEARRKAQQQEQARRQNEINEIEQLTGGHFEKLSAADKSAIALRLTGRHLFASVGETQWPKFLGHMVQGLVDPRISLMGVVQGLSMTFSGVANLVSAEQWKRDPLGNLLKSAADIATGITIVLGSIAALALAIAIILSAIAIIGFLFTGGATAALAPIISFCGTVASTVGGWTIAAAKVALVLQALVFIKNLIDAATATSAKDLQNQADSMTEDTKNAGNMAMQIGMAKVAEVGGKALGETAIGQRMAGGAQAFAEEVGITKPSAAPIAETAPVVGEGTATAAPEPTSVKAPPEGTTPAAEGTPTKATPEGAPIEEPVPVKETGVTSEVETPNGKRSTHLDEPVIEEGIVAKEKTADGQHEVKVTQDGRLVKCSTCAELRAEIGELPDSHPQKQALQERLNQIEANPDPQAKAAQAKQLEQQLAEARNTQQPSPAESAPAQSKGAALAEKLGYPDPEPGYHWAEVNGELVYKRNPLRGEGPQRPERVYDPETQSFKDVESPVAEPVEGEPLTTAQKGKFGEQKADAFMEENGFVKRGSHDAPGSGGGKPKPQGIDGVYENTNPPPKWVVGEAKYDTAGYGQTQSGKQMSEPWADARLDHAVGKKLADQIRLDGYERWELRVDPSGKVIKTKITW
ncbi:hypothetical protein BV372_20350 [Nostoc sp. T09]|uniref:eCIS core domain-containing protein n=1 Tax=Nostoc sp. T09 TaxID=1932621 RepID=UPI000A37904A|nr:DUF4157 domain-containing protein [Nostoc sp. T09]OUL31315.1 hypothetical protein BV372_20350 [Nostoc sp. T09]